MLTVVIMQGPPGSGKSTVANALYSQSIAEMRWCTVCSTDHYFIDPITGAYQFDGSRLAQYHKMNQDKARYALSMNHSVIIDNCNIRCADAKPYFALAREFGAVVVVVRVSGRFQNLHGVPPEKVEAMRCALEDLEVLRVSV